METRAKWMMLLALLFSVATLAVPPEPGVYYNGPHLQGSGYYVELQGSTAVIVVYTYDEATGEPVFYYGAGDFTEGEEIDSDNITPRPQTINVLPYDAVLPLYQFEQGPCLTCSHADWRTEEHAKEVGLLRSVFINTGDMRFMGDGLFGSRWIYPKRQIFARPGWFMGIWNQAPVDVSTEQAWRRTIPDLRGTWVFSAYGSENAPLRVLNFNRMVGPYTAANDVFEGDSKPGYRPGNPIVSFKDDAGGKDLTCMAEGCRLTGQAEPRILIRREDVAIDHMLGFVGPPQGVVLGDYNYYRGDDLVRAVRIADPIPDAPPAPEGN